MAKKRSYLTKTFALYLRLFGLDLDRFTKCAFEFPRFVADFVRFKKLKGNDTEFKFGKLYPVISDRQRPAGNAKRHYFQQDIYVARQIFEKAPRRHIDIGSRIDGFVAHVAVFREIEVFDIRELTSTVRNIHFKQADLMSLPESMENSCDSLSCLHAIEHFGLGRYGDKLNYWGHRDAVRNMISMLQPGGRFYLSAPIGPQRIEFNAHRVFSIKYLFEICSVGLTIESFSFIDDSGRFYENFQLNEMDLLNNCGCSFGLGIFIFIKSQSVT